MRSLLPDYLYMADQARTERSDVDAQATAPLRQLEDAFRSYESLEESLAEVCHVHDVGLDPLLRTKLGVQCRQMLGVHPERHRVARGLNDPEPLKVVEVQLEPVAGDEFRPTADPVATLRR